MVDWLSPDEAMRYFGVDLPGLEKIVADYNIDADIDLDGQIVAVNAADVKEPLFVEHEKEVGYRPDDEEMHDQFALELANAEQAAKADRDTRINLLKRRVV